MATDDTSETGFDGDNAPEGMLIGARLKGLAQSLGLKQRTLALKCGIDPRHFNSLWNNKKRAGMPLISRIARRTGRSVAWLCGEEAARPQIGTTDAQGRVHMAADTDTITPGTIYFVESAGLFPAGTRVLIDPSSTFAAGQWMLIESRGERWWAGGRVVGGEARLLRLDGEELIYKAERHTVLGVIVHVLGIPPAVPSA